VISATGGRERERPAAFSDEPFPTALARAKTEGRWLLVDVTDASKPIAWATLYTTWRDPDVVAWLEANAVAIQVDARLDSEAARALGVDSASTPMVMLFRDGEQRCRIQGHSTAAELLKKFERAEIADGNLALARRMLKNPERDMMDRTGLADALLGAGLLDEALGHYDWLWQQMAKVDEEMAGYRRSFMAHKIAELCENLPAARGRFTEHRERAAAAASTRDRTGLEACLDLVVLDDVLGDEARTLAWFDALDDDQKHGLPEIFSLHLVPLLYERERWKDAGGLIRNPIEDLDAIIERAQRFGEVRPGDHGAYERYLILEGRAAEARRARRHRSRGLHGDVMILHRSLTAAGREQDAAAVRDAALRFEDSAAMRAALR